MKHTIARVVDWYLLIAGVIGVLYAVGVFGIPSTLWIDVRSIIIADTEVGGEVDLIASRTIRRDFNGRYDVVTRTVPGLRPVCWAGADIHYRPVEQSDMSASLDWWSDGEPRPCKSGDLPVGRYILTACWTVENPLRVLPNKELCVDSNVFRVFGPENEALHTQQGVMQRQIDNMQEQLRAQDDES